MVSGNAGHCAPGPRGETGETAMFWHHKILGEAAHATATGASGTQVSRQLPSRRLPVMKYGVNSSGTR